MKYLLLLYFGRRQNRSQMFRIPELLSKSEGGNNWQTGIKLGGSRWLSCGESLTINSRIFKLFV